jgi:hypothetical protein
VKNLRSLTPFLVALLAACGGPLVSTELPPVSFARDSHALEEDNGRTLNGRTLNGRTLNGTDLSGVVLGVSINGVKLSDGQGLDSFSVQASRLQGIRGAEMKGGDDFLWAEFKGNLGDGGQARLRVESIAPAPEPNADLATYYVTYQGEDGLWYPACTDNYGVPTYALAMNGRWNFQSGVQGGGSKIEDSSNFTFACLGAAIAKCVLWGYRPWASYNGVPLAPYHQACTRMVRADYCGDGTSYTQNGRRIDIYDNLGIQQDTDGWVLESAWTPSGAACFRSYNRSQTGVNCYKPAYEQSCDPGAPLASGDALIALEIPPQ